MSQKNPAAQALGALGGFARARKLTKEEKSAAGRKAGLASAAKRKEKLAGEAQSGKGQSGI